MCATLKSRSKNKSKTNKIGLPPNKRYCLMPLARHNAIDLGIVIFGIDNFCAGLLKSGGLFPIPQVCRGRNHLIVQNIQKLIAKGNQSNQTVEVSTNMIKGFVI